MDNVQECYKKLHGLIVSAGRNIVRGETSSEQAERVKDLYVDPAVAHVRQTNTIAK